MHASRRPATKRNVRVVILIIMAAVITVSVSLLYYAFVEIDYRSTIPMDVQVGTHVGLNAGNDSLHFGLVPLRGAGHREVTVRNDRPFPLQVFITLRGEVSRWADVSNRSFSLGPNESKNIAFVVKIPDDASEGNYTGSARIIFKRS